MSNQTNQPSRSDAAASPQPQNTQTPNIPPLTRDDIHALNGEVEKLMKSFEDYEVSYRDIGNTYHSTELRSRSLSYFSAARLQRMKAAFELSTPEQYAEFFAPWHTMLSLLKDVRGNLHTVGSEEERSRRHKHIHALMEEAKLISTSARATLNAVMQDVDELYRRSRQILDLENESAWGTPEDAPDVRHPALPYPSVRGVEWDIVRAWVWSLPETQKMIDTGARSLDEVTLDVLYGEETDYGTPVGSSPTYSDSDSDSTI